MFSWRSCGNDRTAKSYCQLMSSIMDVEHRVNRAMTRRGELTAVSQSWKEQSWRQALRPFCANGTEAHSAP